MFLGASFLRPAKDLQRQSTIWHSN